jgi:hypothetical protein
MQLASNAKLNRRLSMLPFINNNDGLFHQRNSAVVKTDVNKKVSMLK